MSKDLIKKHSEGITHNTIGSILASYFIQGVPAMMGLITALLAYLRSGVPLYLVILIGSVVFFLLSLAWYYFARRRLLNAAPELPSESVVIESVNTQHESEVKELKERIRQLEAEKAARAKLDITGSIKEVFLEEYANGELSNSKQMYFDFHFIINIYLANHGAVTTIEQFKLVLKAGEHSYDGEKESDAEWRAWGAEELIDIEKLNDVPLEHTRNGSLWFVVKGVPGNKNKSEMELELCAIDKDGTSYKLDTLPQTKWRRNPFREKAAMEESRARMKRYF